ncbi:PH domain-containing protein [Aquibacillus saliphilus]|uniref:PH domain-containing protein n=1 Tax=Aquibacillus saliphilus TaxID=1909422 RepID=UPI001CEFF29A|nr:PH domain-containing protein [Aquibacillus saliphilus]
MMSSPKRLHPAAMIFTVITSIKQLVYALIPIIILFSNDGFFNYVILGIIGIAILLIGHSILSWLRYTYIVEGDQLRIEQGVIIRTNRTISKNRIQSIDLTQGIIHRLFGLTKVQIETAGSDRSVDAALSAVTFEEGQYLHNELKHKNETSAVGEDSGEKPGLATKAISNKRLLIAGSTSGSFGVILSLVALAFSELESFIPETVYTSTTRWLSSQAMEFLIVVAFVLFILLWGLGILGIVIKYGKFTITRYENELFITRGLLEKKQMTIPIKRIQAVSIKETLIRQPLGFATLSVEIAGGEQENKKVTETLLFPLLKKSDVPAFLSEILPEYQNMPDSYSQVPKRGLIYYLLRTTIIPILALIGVAIALPEWIILPIIVVLVSIALGIAQYRTASYHLTESQLTLRLRLLSKETVMLKTKRIQAVEKSQHILHRKQDLANMKFSVLNNFGGKHYLVNELALADSDKIVDWYSYRKKEF